jgi:Asp/Glu/hydantoin racemase
VKLAFIFPGKESEKDANPAFFKSMRETIDSVRRPDTTVEIYALPNDLPDEAEMAYWYVHPKMFSAMIGVARRAQKDGMDAVVVGCVGSTDAEYGIKEVLDIPAVGIGESCLLMAQLLGQNFSIMTYDNKIAAWIDRMVRERHLEDFCVSVRPANIPLEEMMGRSSMARIYERVLNQAKLAITEDRADVIVNGSAGFVGLADYLRKRVEAPVVDAIEAGIKFGEMMADLKKSKNLYQSKVYTFKPSPNVDKVLGKYF